MPAPTSSELVAAMSSRGVTISTTEADGVICLLSPAIACLELNYPDECVRSALLLWASILLASSTGGRYVTSQHAPSGASQSFAYGTKPWTSLYNQLRLLDPKGCLSGLISDPGATGQPFFKVVTGKRGCC